MHVLVTAGPTREYLDAVRYLTSPSSGRMGFAVAAAARRAGHRVTLVAGPTHLPAPRGVRVVRVTTAREMARATLAAFRRADALVMTAAVADYRPERRRRGKWKKGPGRLALRLVRNPDILAACGRLKGRRVLVGFAVEVKDPLASARRKLSLKHLDALFLTDPRAFGALAAEYTLLLPGEPPRQLGAIAKRQLATQLVALLQHAGGQTPRA